MPLVPGQPPVQTGNHVTNPVRWDESGSRAFRHRQNQLSADTRNVLPEGVKLSDSTL